jgi:hypothetical protein
MGFAHLLGIRLLFYVVCFTLAPSSVRVNPGTSERCFHEGGATIRLPAALVTGAFGVDVINLHFFGAS